MKKETKCNNCGKSNAIGYCKMCHESLCANCVEVHNKWSRFSNHKIVDVILVQNLLSVVEKFREVKGALTDSIKKGRETKPLREGQRDYDQSWNIDKLLHFLTEEGKSIEDLSTDDKADHLFVSLMELNSLLVKQDLSAFKDYDGAAIAISRTVLQRCTSKVNDVNCTDVRLLSFSLSIELPASGHVVIPVSSIKCRLIPMIKGKEQHKDKYKIMTTSAPGIYQVNCCPLASGAHSLSVHIYDVQLESVSLMVPFNPHFDTIAPARAIYGLQSNSNVAVGNNGIVMFTKFQPAKGGVQNFDIQYFNSQNITVPQFASIVKNYNIPKLNVVNVLYVQVAYNVYFSSKNDVIVISKQHIEILTLQGTLVRAMSDPIDFLNSPSCAVASSKTGYIYIADVDNVHILSSDLRYIRSFGKNGEGNQEFKGVNGLAIAVIDGEEFLYVTDRGNHRIQKFTHLGEYLSTFGTQGSDPGQLQYPCGIAVGTGSLLYITEWGNHRISVFTFGGDFVRCFGGQGTNIDQFNYPNVITFDSNGVMYVYDSNNKRLILY
uniref:B box-type domain-containing protein n=1 Tax=Amphimedon queenslandica TaxID=400682 RepID=A0A1X7T2Q4_AMPQE